MFDQIGKPLFAAMADAAEALLGAGSESALAIRAAATSQDSADIARAETLLKALPEETRTAIAEAAHCALRADPLSLMQQNLAATARSKPN